MSVMTSGIVIQMQASLRKLANDPQNREWMDKYIDNCIILEEIIEDLQKYRREGFVFTTIDLYRDRLRNYLWLWKEIVESATDPLNENELWKMVTLSYFDYIENSADNKAMIKRLEFFENSDLKCTCHQTRKYGFSK